MQVFGIDAIVRIVSHFSFIYLAFWSLRSLRIENLFKSFKETQVRLAILMLAIALGFACSTFFRNHSFMQKYIFDI